MNTSQAIFWLAIIVLVIGGAWWYFYGSGQEMLPIQAEYGGKVVYTTDTTLDEKPFRADCRVRGGTFSSCGTTCEPEAAFCAEVCAYVCEIPQGGTSDWGTYQNATIGFSMPYRMDMRVSTSTEASGRFADISLWGPTQEPNTEFYDGVQVSVGLWQLADGQTAEEFAQQQEAQAADIGEILVALETVSFAGLDGYSYRAQTVGAPHNVMVLEYGAGEVLIISSLAPDPTEQGFEQMRERMLAGFELLNS